MFRRGTDAAFAGHLCKLPFPLLFFPFYTLIRAPHSPVSWGFSYSFPSILVHLQQHSPWRHSSLATLSSIGSILLALQFFLPIFVMAFFRRYPEWRIVVLSTSVVVNCGAMLVASWATEVRFFSLPPLPLALYLHLCPALALLSLSLSTSYIALPLSPLSLRARLTQPHTQTWHLIILQGVLGGITGAILYSPVLIYLNEWFVQKKGFASGIVFSGAFLIPKSRFFRRPALPLPYSSPQRLPPTSSPSRLPLYR